MVDRVDVPVAIGGGFCDGRGLVAVLAMGGEAVYHGTRFCGIPGTHYSSKGETNDR